MPRGLAPKLILSVTAIVFLVEGVFAFINARIQERQLLDEVVMSAEGFSETITTATWHAMLEDHRQSAYRTMESIGRQEWVRRVRIFNKSGLITFSTGPDANTRVDMTAEACDLCHTPGETLVKPQASSRVRKFVEDGHHYLGMITPIYNEPACSTAACHAHPPEQLVLGVLDISLPLDRLDGEVAGIRIRAVLVGAVSVLLIGLFVVFFSRHFFVRPVRKLIEATKSVGAMDLTHPVEVGGDDELGELGRSFDSMREHLLVARTEIEDFTRNLEDMVAERSMQLEATQQKLVQADRLASLGRLAASVAHEINNPLSGVLNFAALMQRLMRAEGIPPDRVDDFRKYLSTIVTETSRAGRIVTDLLSFSRRRPDQNVPSDLNEVVRRTMSVTSHRLEQANVNLVIDLAKDLPRPRLDPSQIQQVLTNLVLNAAEAVGESGRVEVRTRAADGGAVELVVTDDGEGISPEHLARIFDPFFTTKEEGKGVGLGLAVVYGIVEAHGGTIDVMSKPGVGTIFTVRLPCDGDRTDGSKADE